MSAGLLCHIHYGMYVDPISLGATDSSCHRYLVFALATANISTNNSVLYDVKKK